MADGDVKLAMKAMFLLLVAVVGYPVQSSYQLSFSPLSVNVLCSPGTCHFSMCETGKPT
jgi:hypothetical protein